MRRFLAHCTGWIAAACAIAACAPAPGPGTAQPSAGTGQPSATNTAGPAWRQWFPSLSGYTEVGEKWGEKGTFNQGEIAKFVDGTGYLAFRTPDGLDCRMRVGNSGKGDRVSEAGCWGELPSAPGRAKEVYAIGGDRPAQFLAATDAYAARGEFRPLRAMQVLTDMGFEGDTVACAVDGSGLTACLLHVGTTDGAHDHGFVLDPNGSWVF
ncbi:hypothetical protein [Mycobacteroides salmoniphilum]|uniref:hypothetical protein n=1 Tax=Mycobacteroides salmoniphilum TaxID=404941 RepID=UPI001066DA80|nr:hypothetical protein [Mycobacteroides salmoniphilum]TDZ76848.1 hypothetical protein DE4586_03092 [Mycobacteroides salmoniphilum]TDZ87008.1 hypothetical protein DE4587_01934 [Mycobacteroides salmoniphilum]